ncbi:MAG: FAD-binding oxidoreductase, partial [Gammaproteobacteria bacterium]|nr:FAD-binding oxidoreductase [Gammaproteobacteria bacterium]
IIVGGGVVGSAIAYFLAAEQSFDGSIAVIERDPAYADATTPRSVGGIRQQFSTPENIRLSIFAAEFVKRAERELEVDGERPALGFIEAGYLFLANKAQAPVLRANHAIQTEHGARVTLMDAAALAARFSWLAVDGLDLGAHGEANEGWIDPYALLMAFRNKARALGADYLEGEVAEVRKHGKSVTGVRLADGNEIGCGWLVNAAGALADRVAEMAGVELPVRPRKRQVFVFECRETLPACPLVIDASGMYFRPESGRFLCGISPPERDDPDTLDHEVDYSIFDDTLWPLLARRVPAFEAIRLSTAWACTYAYNTLDQNAVIGAHPDLGNLVFANGFSGHGLQQSPGVGRAVAELITFGGYRSIDLSRFGYQRIALNAPIKELNVV